jgi:hypothetical protein
MLNNCICTGRPKRSWHPIECERSPVYICIALAACIGIYVEGQEGGENGCASLRYQSLSLLQSGRARLTPPRSKGGNILPPRIVVCTIGSTSWVDTRPYHIPAPWGMYICTYTIVQYCALSKGGIPNDNIACVLVSADVRSLEN